MNGQQPFTLDHVGIVVRDLEPWLERFTYILRVDRSDVNVSTVRDPESGELVEAAFISIGTNRIEFICPRPGSTSRFAKHMDLHGEGLYHVALYVDRFADLVQSWSADGTPLDVLTVSMSAAAEADDLTEPQRIVDIAWVPPELSGGINVELVDAHPAPVHPPSR